MKTKDILVVTGTRAEYGMLRSTMDAIRAHPRLNLKLLVTGIHTLKVYGYTLNEIISDGYTVDRVVAIPPKADMLQSLAHEIEGIRDYCQKARPHCVVILGDRDEPLAAALVAAHLNIPIAHIHGGDITGPGVDESNRHAMTKYAHLHFPGTKTSARRIRAMAEDPSRIHTVGSVVVDMVLNEKRFSRKEVAEALKLDAGKPWLTIVQHPSAFDDAPLHVQIDETIEATNGFAQHEKIVLYPNTDEGSGIFVKKIAGLRGSGYRVFKSIPRNLFMSLVSHSDALVGNSSAGVIETAYLGTPTVNIGGRQRGRERSRSVIDAPYDSKKIAVAIKRSIALKKKNKGKPFPSPYGKAGAGRRIANVLARQLQRVDLLHKGFGA